MTISCKQTGTVIIEVSNSNPNGNIEDNTPRTFPDGRGWISPMCLKRRLFRDILADHDSAEFNEICQALSLDPERFYVAETRDRGYENMTALEAKNAMVKLFKNDPDAALARYGDIRLFGSTMLDGGDPDDKKDKGQKLRAVRTGCVQFSLAESISEIDVVIEGLVKHAPLEDDKCKGENSNFGQGAIRLVRHGLYVCHYYISPNEARKSQATDQDIDLLKYCIPLGFELSKSAQRAGVKVVAAFHALHDSALGSFPEHIFTRAATPVLKEGVDVPESIDDYIMPTIESINEAMSGRKARVEDLVANRFEMV